jgi:hypothetical protein
MESGYEFKKHPVVSLDMSVGSKSPSRLEENLLDMLCEIAVSEEIDLNKPSPDAALKKLISELYKKYKTGVVILIDEYDAPVSSKLDDQDLAAANTKILRSFYASFKTVAQAGMLRFVLVTGVTRYAMLGISAGLNNLKDISFRSDYASVCGFTHDELDQYFADFFPSALEKTISSLDLPAGSAIQDLRASLLDFYDGYSWDGKTRVLNPFSLVNFFDEAEFSRFWRNTSPSLTMLSQVVSDAPKIFLPGKTKSLKAEDCIVSFVGNPPTLATLFHTGYLTIDTVTGTTKDKIFNFKIPNEEVKNDIFNILAKIVFAKRVKDPDAEKEAIRAAITQKDTISLAAYINALYAGLVHFHHMENESFYHSLLWAYFRGLFKHAEMEQPGSIGNLDLIVGIGENIYAVIELKYGHTEVNIDRALDKLARNALETISAKQYGQKYRMPGNTVIDIGLGVFGRGQVKAIFDNNT